MFLPVLHEQQVIASFIRLLDKRIERQMELVETLKKYKRGVLSVAFGKYGSICSRETTQYPFSVLASRRSEKYDPRSGEQMPCVELEHIEQETGRIIGSIPSTQQNSIKSVCKSGDTLFGKLRPYLRKYAFVKEDMVCSSEIWSLVPSETIIPEYLFYLVQTDEFIKIANISSGTKMPRAEWSNIEKSVFSVPSKEVQAQIVQTLRGLDSRILDAIDLLDELQFLKRGLMQQLFI
jgi:type I restriction enzyme S subunit